jgi:hypothetical protein
MSDFAITYPAFFLLNEHDVPELVEIDGNLCVCLFTDVDLVRTFYRDKHGKGPANAQAIVMHSWSELLQFVKQWQPAFEQDGIRFVAFDVSPRRRPFYGELVQLIALLEAESE